MPHSSLLSKLNCSRGRTCFRVGGCASLLVCCLTLGVQDHFQEAGLQAARTVGDLPVVALELQNPTDQVILAKLTGDLWVWVPYPLDIPGWDEDYAVVSVDGRYELVPPTRDGLASVLVVPPRSRVFVDAKIRPLNQAEVDMQTPRIPIEGETGPGRLPEYVRAEIGIAPFTDLRSQFEQLLEWGGAEFQFHFETPDRMTLSRNKDGGSIPFNRFDIATTRWSLTLGRPF